MSNISFRAIRKYAQYEWEVYFDSTSNGYIAICHLFSGNVQAETWDDIWLEIIKSSKKQIKLEKKNRCNSMIITGYKLMINDKIKSNLLPNCANTLFASIIERKIFALEKENFMVIFPK